MWVLKTTLAHALAAIDQVDQKHSMADLAFINRVCSVVYGILQAHFIIQTAITIQAILIDTHQLICLEK